MMDLPAIGVAIGSLCGSFIAIIAFWVKFSDRVTKADARAEEAKQDAAAAIARVITVEKELVDHRVKVASEYVSKETLAEFRIEVLGAISRLGDRLDSMFKASH